MHGDETGQGPLLAIFPIVLVLIGVIMIFVGISTASGGCVGTGLMWIGGGIIIGDFGGFVVVKHPFVLIGGGAGFVVILIGAAARAFLSC